VRCFAAIIIILDACHHLECTRRFEQDFAAAVVTALPVQIAIQPLVVYKAVSPIILAHETGGGHLAQRHVEHTLRAEPVKIAVEATGIRIVGVDQYRAAGCVAAIEGALRPVQYLNLRDIN